MEIPLHLFLILTTLAVSLGIVIQRHRSYLLKTIGVAPAPVPDVPLNVEYANRFHVIPAGGTFNGIDCVYCIYLENSVPNRYEHMRPMLQSYGVDVKYFKALTPEDIIDKYPKFSSGHSTYTRKNTKLAVHLSYITCLMDALANGHETIIIFEDDMEIKADKATVNKHIQEFLNCDCDAFYMGYCWLSCEQSKYTRISENLLKVPKTQKILCKEAIAYKTHFLKRLINETLPMYANSDDMISDFYSSSNDLNVCIPNNVLFEQNRKTYGSYNQNHKSHQFTKCDFSRP